MGVFGANYCLTSSNDFRAAGYVGRDYKSMIDEDLIHFSRMGWKALRLCLWGDWECCDKDGNLLENEHIDCLDYLIAKASERGITMLLSPITTYDAGFADAMGTRFPGISAHYAKDELITDKEAVKAQANYMTQLLRHVNPYTGRQIGKEPWITFVELINEPAMLIDKPEETRYYIRTMIEAVRKAGCDKLLYYNVSQDFRIIPILKDTGIQGGTYAWYPTGLNHNYTVKGNILPLVADYPQIGNDIGRRSRLVYEFDTPDVSDGYLYPAMVREYREGGVQFAAMFTYDFLATAKWNLSWSTHHLNMVYTPHKAISSIIAAEAMSRLKLGSDWGAYPDNSSFGDFLVDYDRNLSLLNAEDALMYNSDICDIAPKNPSGLTRIVGMGNSRLVRCNGRGIYFLDRIAEGRWRLEVHPSIFQINDPHTSPGLDRPDYVVDDAPVAFTFALPGMPDGFIAKSIEGKTVKNENGRLMLSPGVYVLSAKDFFPDELPLKVGGVNMKDFVTAPRWMPEEPVIIHEEPKEIIVGENIRLECSIFSEQEPDRVFLTIGGHSRWGAKPSEMKKVAPHTWAAELPARDKPGIHSYGFSMTCGGERHQFPEKYNMKAINPDKVPLRIFTAGTDDRYDFSRYYNSVASIPYTPEFTHRMDYDEFTEAFIEISCEDLTAEGDGPADISFSKFVADELAARNAAGITPKSLVIEAQAVTPDTERILVVFTQSDCRSWSVTVPLDSRMSPVEIPLAKMKADVGAMLPRDFPGVNPYYYPDLNRTGEEIDWNKVEKCTVSMRSDLYTASDSPKTVRIKSISLKY